MQKKPIMFRNSLKSCEKGICCINYKSRLRREFSISCMYAKNVSLGTNANRQGKVMQKLFGNRVTGSKKRWYPEAGGNGTQNGIFAGSQFGKLSKGTAGGKNVARRSAVLNKLFMVNITDMLATGAVSESIVGRGLAVTRVKIAPDFAFVNVFWMGNGDVAAEKELEEELQRCSGLLRHELSQLRLMGEVPRIHFVRDKTNINLAHVETLLKNMDFGPPPEEDPEGGPEKDEVMRRAPVDAVKYELFGGQSPQEKATQLAEAEEPYVVPEMRHDVFGLDHRQIMSKILTKMRKSQQAWELHNRAGDGVATIRDIASESQLEKVQRKLAESAENAAKFEDFLTKRRDRKNTPERKKHDRAHEAAFAELRGGGGEEHEFSPTNQYDTEDYLHDEENDRRS